MSFNGIEKKIARFVSSSPYLKRLLKFGYQSLHLGLSGTQFKTKFRLKSGWTIKRVQVLFDSKRYADFFGYFDVSPWNDSQSHILNHIYDKYEKKLMVSCHNIKTGQNYNVASTDAYNWQQGSRLQWVSNEDFIFNDYQNGKFIARLFNQQGCLDEFEFPLQVLHPNRLGFLSINYARLKDYRPDYGYDGHDSRFSNIKDENDGIWFYDFKMKNVQQIVNLSELKSQVHESNVGSHKVNHCLFSPDGAKFVFMHRFLLNGRRVSRLFLWEDNKLNFIFESAVISHYCWINNEELFTWLEKDGKESYYIVNVVTGIINPYANQEVSYWGDGHPSYCDGKIVMDTYPNRQRYQTLRVLDLTTNNYEVVAELYAPLIFNEVRRCDLHPRWSPNGKSISVDSLHEGTRHQYIITEEQ